METRLHSRLFSAEEGATRSVSSGSYGRLRTETYTYSMLSDVSTINLEKGWPGKPLLMQDSSKLSFGLFFFHSLPRVPIFRRASPTLLWLDF
jgi:hypothetical protein